VNVSTVQHFLFLIGSGNALIKKKKKMCIRVSSNCDPKLNYSHVESHVISVVDSRYYLGTSTCECLI